MRKITVIVLATMVVSFSALPTTLVQAHQNGCHRWHSCPSDTGSYVCGDLGYDNYCGGETYYEEPDYQGQGSEKGAEHADGDRTSIVSMATNQGDTAGYEDGRADNSNSVDPDPSVTCDKTFNFTGFSPDEYKDAYQEAYSEKCNEIYSAAFESAYESGFERGKADYSTAQATKDESDESSSDESNLAWIWWLLVGGGVASAYGLSKDKG